MHKSDKIHAHTIMMNSVQALYCNWDCHWDCLRILGLLDKREDTVSAIIYTQQISRQLRLDVDRHNSQYPPIEISVFRRSHDRFLCIDDTVYHVGASIKDLGKKWFAFSKMEDFMPEELVAKINENQTGSWIDLVLLYNCKTITHANREFWVVRQKHH